MLADEPSPRERRIDKDEANCRYIRVYPSSSRRKSDSRRELFIKVLREISVIKINRNRFLTCARLLTSNINGLRVVVLIYFIIYLYYCIYTSIHIASVCIHPPYSPITCDRTDAIRENKVM